MKFKIIIYIFILAIFLGCSSDDTPFGNTVKLTPLKCDLNEKSCENDNKVIFEISPRPILAMQKHTLKIKGLQNNFKNPIAVFKGVNMYMGDIKTPLRFENGEFIGEFALSFCVMNTMRYRVEIYDNDEPSGIFIEFDVFAKK